MPLGNTGIHNKVTSEARAPKSIRDELKELREFKAKMDMALLEVVEDKIDTPLIEAPLIVKESWLTKTINKIKSLF